MLSNGKGLVVMRTSAQELLLQVSLFHSSSSEHELTDFHTTDLQTGFHSIHFSADWGLKYQLNPETTFNRGDLYAISPHSRVRHDDDADEWIVVQKMSKWLTLESQKVDDESTASNFNSFWFDVEFDEKIIKLSMVGGSPVANILYPELAQMEKTFKANVLKQN